jgi:hypothetical protein
VGALNRGYPVWCVLLIDDYQATRDIRSRFPQIHSVPTYKIDNQTAAQLKLHMSYRYTTRLVKSNITHTLRLGQLNSHLSSQSRRTMATSIPKTMKGVLIEKTGGVEVLQYKTDLPVPTPKEGEVLVKNEFIGVNYIDTYVVPSHPNHQTTNLTSPPVISAPDSTPLQSPRFLAVKPKA